MRPQQELLLSKIIEQIKKLERQDILFFTESFGKRAERFGWSASVWLSKQLIVRTSVPFGKAVLVTANVQRPAQMKQGVHVSSVGRRQS